VGVSLFGSSGVVAASGSTCCAATGRAKLAIRIVGRTQLAAFDLRAGIYASP
jgi:hypothetical protein